MKWAVIVLVLLVACQPVEQLEPPGAAEPKGPLVEEESVRPDIPRVELPPEIVLEPESGEGAERRSFLNSLSQGVPSEGIVAGTPEYPLLKGTLLGEALPALTKREISVLRMEPPRFRGQSLRAEAFIRFDFEDESTGELRFVRDGDSDAVLSEIYFEEEKVMFEYAYLLYDGAFPILVDEEFDFFGTRYVVAEASNTTLLLQGIDAERYLVLSNGSKLKLNGKTYGNTLVLVDPYSIIIQYFAPDVDDDGLQLQPGESIRKRLNNPEILLHPLFDVHYDGLEQSAQAMLQVESVGERAVATFFNTEGVQFTLDLASNVNGDVVLGDGEHSFHFTECESFEDFCIEESDEFPVIAQDGTLGIFEYRNVNEEGNTLILRDGQGEQHIVKVKDMERTSQGLEQLDGSFSFHGTLFRLRVLHNETGRSKISVDLDGNGGVNGREVPIVLFYDYELSIVSEADDEIVLLLEGNDVRRDIGNEEIEITLIPRNGDVLVRAKGAFELLEDKEEDDLFFGLSDIGSYITLDKVSQGYGDELLIEYPADYRQGIVRVTG